MTGWPLLFSIPVHAAIQDDEQAIEIAFESHNHGKHGQPRPPHKSRSEAHTMVSFLMGQLSWFGVLEPRSWEDGSTTIYC